MEAIQIVREKVSALIMDKNGNWSLTLNAAESLLKKRKFKFSLSSSSSISYYLSSTRKP